MEDIGLDRELEQKTLNRYLIATLNSKQRIFTIIRSEERLKFILLVFFFNKSFFFKSAEFVLFDKKTHQYISATLSLFIKSTLSA